MIGAVLDRNGLRPGRWWRTGDGLVVLASEAGVLDIDPADGGRARAGCSRAGCSSSTPRPGRIVEDDEIKAELAAAHPYADWLHAGLMQLRRPARPRARRLHRTSRCMRRQQTFGYTEEELRILLAPMARTGAEPIGSMGTDTPIAVLCERPRLLFDYFTPAVRAGHQPAAGRDPRGAGHQRCRRRSGPEGNLLDPGPATCRQIVLPFPVIDNDELAKILHINDDGDLPGFRAVTVSRPVPGRRRRRGAARPRSTEICREVSEAIEDGARILVLSDRDSTADLAPIPSLLLTAAVHHHLIREQTRTQVGLVVETGDAREVHHVALLHRLRRRRGQPVPGVRDRSRT